MRGFLLLSLFCVTLSLRADPSEASLRTNAAQIVQSSQLYTIEPTGSMEPTIGNHTVVFTQMIPWESLRVGDIIVYETPAHELYVHRIVSISSKRSYMILKGDANGGSDPWYVTREMYRGKVLAIVERDTVKENADEKREEIEEKR